MSPLLCPISLCYPLVLRRVLFMMSAVFRKEGRQHVEGSYDGRIVGGVATVPPRLKYCTPSPQSRNVSHTPSATHFDPVRVTSVWSSHSR